MANDLAAIRPTMLASDVVLPAVASGMADGPALIAVGGGKDSIVAIESARRVGCQVVLGSVRTHRAIADTAREIGSRLVYVRGSARDDAAWAGASADAIATALVLAPVILLAAFLAAVGPSESAVRGSLVEALEYE